MKKNLCVFSIFVLFLWCVLSIPIVEIEWIDEPDGEYEYGDFFEGDMDLSDEQLAEIYGDRNALIGANFRWPNATVPYKLSANHSLKQKEWILGAMAKIQNVSCVRFRQRINETDYVEFKANNRCYSNVGHQGGKQLLNLDNSFSVGGGCFRTGTILHELLHTLGFMHMQSAFDRDNYVQINLKNVRANKSHNFEKYNASWVTHFNMTYDYKSIMHYSQFAFSKDKKTPTIIPLAPEDKIEDILSYMGQRTAMTDTDIHKLNLMYQCNSKISSKHSSTSRSFTSFIPILLTLMHIHFFI